MAPIAQSRSNAPLTQEKVIASIISSLIVAGVLAIVNLAFGHIIWLIFSVILVLCAAADTTVLIVLRIRQRQ